MPKSSTPSAAKTILDVYNDINISTIILMYKNMVFLAMRLLFDAVSVISFFLISLEYVSGVDFVFYIVEGVVISICDDGLGAEFEFVEVVYYFAAEEGCAVF